jgi:hypothetical protein
MVVVADRVRYPSTLGNLVSRLLEFVVSCSLRHPEVEDPGMYVHGLVNGHMFN